MTPDMSTKNRGSILPAERSSMAGPIESKTGQYARNAFRQPDDVQYGPNGDADFDCDNVWEGMD